MSLSRMHTFPHMSVVWGSEPYYRCSCHTAGAPTSQQHRMADMSRPHPDRNFVEKIVKYTNSGVPIGPRTYRVHDNWDSAYRYGRVVHETLIADVEAGTKFGPFSSPPFSAYLGSPLGAFSRKRSDKYRISHDLSWPPTVNKLLHIQGRFQCRICFI